MLAAAQRLRRSSEFAAAVRGGRRAGRGTLVVHLTLPETPGPEDIAPKPVRDGADAESAPVSRAGFVVSKAVGPAVVRNKVRRRLRHLTRERLAGLPTGTTLVVRALPAAADATYQRLGADLDAALAAARSGRGRRHR
ncbi:ribonuclease P protein component [Micromonospora phaseoli]|uniref:Ribonuclease P protein component n=1 Tax=Micromonospora phaseoli TaxID=1144548 RepID=A0A1H7BB80_9ACTN|nr:ribonuclease P protein component [Micromonospora phaseoli]PZV95064.1 ribonuclease P protein component [Micromonospora phaseoli]GIJ79511.1 ribonuclease P protein component [Micromonospora phaseoli]SEJ74943.1 ribonuclease P protein component [Micromonospora phaseoli]